MLGRGMKAGTPDPEAASLPPSRSRGRGPTSLTELSNVVAYACRPLSLEGSASCSFASMICLQCQHAMAQRRRSHPTAFPDLYMVYKNSRSPAGVQAQCCFVLAALIGVALAEIAETALSAGRRKHWRPPRGDQYFRIQYFAAPPTSRNARPARPPPRRWP